MLGSLWNVRLEKIKIESRNLFNALIEGAVTTFSGSLFQSLENPTEMAALFMDRRKWRSRYWKSRKSEKHEAGSRPMECAFVQATC